MRPERVVVEGFGTFRERTEIDFSGVELFALTGPTGAGKSTVIDAIVFALYGVIPRLDDRTVVAPAISQDKVEAKVQLDFSVGQERYTAVRVVRETPPPKSGKKASAGATPRGTRGATTKEARLERRISETETEVLAGTADELTPAVERLLGLTFEHFTTCVVLPQGEFARFLHHKPRHRQDLLVELLDLGVYAQMATLARSRERSAQQQVEWLGKERATLAFATTDAAAACRARVATLETLLKTLDERQPELDAMALRQRELHQQAADAADCVARLSAIEVPKGIDELASDAAAASAAVTDATSHAKEAAEAFAAAEHAREALGDRTAFELTQRDHAEVAKLRERMENGARVVAAGTADMEAAQAAADEARRRHEEAVGELERARLADRAADLAGHLVTGEPCPVCGNDVHTIPKIKAPGLKKLEQAEKRARAAYDTASEQAAKEALAHARNAEKLVELETRVAELAERLAGKPAAAEVTKHLQAIAEADDAVRLARDAERRAQQAVSAAEQQQKAVAARSVEAWSVFDDARDGVVVMEPPTPDRSDVLAAWQPLVAWARETAKRYTAEQASITKAIDELQAEHRRLGEQIIEACRDAGVDPGRRPPRDVVVEALSDAKADVDSIDHAIERLADIDERQGALSSEQQVAGLLARHLSANGFEKWLLDEALERLVAAATDVLFTLSGGAYSLVLDGRSNFFVRDHNNAGTLRSARTLSGGETFLASLALALALADQVAEMAAGGAVRLESIFLDEGFGTLDADTLDTVASAIEELGARGRMVGLVSHVRDLAERMPVRYVVTKGPSTSTVERIDL